MSRNSPESTWWPDWLGDLGTEDPLRTNPVIVAEIEATPKQIRRYRQIFTALVPLNRLSAVLAQSDNIGWEVSATGPDPAPYRDKWDYRPRFWIHGGASVPRRLEPLVVSWESTNQTILQPDQGFLMTYGLIPRHVAGEADEASVHWDFPPDPRMDVVVANSVSTHSWGSHSGAVVMVDREFLEDYATIRNRALVQFYYAERSGPLTEDVQQKLGDEQQIDLTSPGRLLNLQLLRIKGEHPVLARVWGVRLLLKPGDAPISGGRWEYEDLVWPGDEDAPTKESLRRGIGTQVAYVQDDVLGRYEGQPGFEIYPESGGVSYRSQWSVSRTERVGRDLIKVDVKKLYEGARGEVVRH